ncbi:hypothetical protein BDZ91DRAFT_170813 [Kalaharituber pfeilii]|nr:hypothetical protein BDZ91DRAFT_170813 [Kalaharituber pfeilii]
MYGPSPCLMCLAGCLYAMKIEVSWQFRIQGNDIGGGLICVLCPYFCLSCPLYDVYIPRNLIHRLTYWGHATSEREC